MKRAFRPFVTPLEDRIPLSTGMGVVPIDSVVSIERVKKVPKTNLLSGTLTGIALDIKSLQIPPTGAYFLGITKGSVNKVAVAGLTAFSPSGFPLSPRGVPNFYLDGEPKSAHHRDYIGFNIVGAPSTPTTPNGPMSIQFVVVKATGVFRNDVDRHVTLTVTLTGPARNGSSFVATLSPS